MTNTATLSSRFQITIPKAIREPRQWEAGQRFAVVPKANGVLLVPVPTLDDLRGLAKGTSTTDGRDVTSRF